MNTPNALIDEIVDFTSDHFGSREHSLCIYGSFGANTFSDRSDIDLFLATHNPTSLDLHQMKEFVIGIHHRHGMPLDCEVPFDNKLLASYDDIDKAAKLQGLIFRNGRIVVPPVKKTREFLSSYRIKLRLLFNALTTPHLIFGNSADRLNSSRETAERNLLLLAINDIRSIQFTVQDLVNSLLRGPHGEEGEMYLGYKRKNGVAPHLTHALEKALSLMETEGTVEHLNDALFLLSEARFHDRLRALFYEKAPSPSILP